MKRWSVSKQGAMGRQYTLDDIEEVRDKVGGIDFQQAAREGNIRVINQYLNSRHFQRKLNKRQYSYMSPVDKLDNQGIAALHYAARYNNADVIETLLEKGANINVRDSEGQTPMHHATRYAPKGTVLNPEQVMFAPQRPDTQKDSDCDGEDNEPIENGDVEDEEAAEAEEDETDVLQDIEKEINNVVYENKDSASATTKKVQIEDTDHTIDELKSFLSRAHSYKKTDKTIEDMVAEEEGSPPILLLHERGADVNAQDHYGLTPLHCAADRGNYPAVLELLKIDSVMVNSRDYQGETALHMAIMYEDVPCIKRLLYNKTKSCDPKIYSNTNMSPLHFACREANLEVVELVFDRVKMVEMKESLDSIIRDQNAESRRMSQLCSKIGVPNITAYQGHMSLLMVRLHTQAKIEEGVNYAPLKRIINGKFKKAMADTDFRMKEHINRTAQERVTCLHLACRDGRSDVVKFLIQNGGDLKAKTGERDTCLHIAAKHGHIDVVRMLISYGCPKESKNRDGETALHEAAKADRFEIVQLLLESGVDIDAKDREGATPLITAAAWGRKQTVQLLLGSGADVSAKDKRECSAIFAAIREDEPGVLKLILECGGPRMIDSELDKFQNTPLHFAAEVGHLLCLKELLKFGFISNAQNEDDKCPLHLAAEFGRKKCTMQLVKYDGSTLHDNDDLSNTPLHYAALNGHVDTCIYLCEMGAEVGARNQTGWTPMDSAAANGNTKTLAALIDADAEIDPIDKAKLTPLHLASKNGHVDSVIFLLENGADIRLVDVNHFNALELAILANKTEVAEAIINHRDSWVRAMGNAQLNGDTPMKKLIRKMPEIAEIVMNKCTDLSNNPPTRTTDSRKFEVQFNYKYITERSSYDQDDTTTSLSSTSNSELDSEASSKVEIIIPTQDSYQVHPLTLMISYKRKDLLNHPLVASLIFCKWSSYGKHFYYGNLSIYTIYLIFLTLYTIYQIPPFITKKVDDDFIKIETCIKSATCTEDLLGYYAQKPPIARISGILVICMCIIRIVIELMQIWFQKMKYITVQNFTEIALFGLSMYFTANVFQQTVISTTQWQLGVFCLLVAWMNMLMFLRKFPGIGIYIVMFVTVLKTFLKIGVVLAIFILAFGLTFNMVIDQYPSYQSEGFSIVRTFVMMTGEMEYDSYFVPSALKAPNPLYYPASTYVMFLIFVIVVPIVFMNLLVGLAVDDIKEVYHDAGLQRSIMKIELIFQVEMLLPRDYLEGKNKNKKTIYPNIKLKIFGSRLLAKYLGPHQLAFNGPDLHSRVTNIAGSGDISAIAMLNKLSMKKMRRQMNEITKQNRMMLSLMKKLLRKQTDDDSMLSSDLNEILDNDSDVEYNAED